MIEKERFELKFKEPFYQEHEIEKGIQIKVDNKYYWINYEEWINNQFNGKLYIENKEQ